MTYPRLYILLLTLSAGVSAWGGGRVDSCAFDTAQLRKEMKFDVMCLTSVASGGIGMWTSYRDIRRMNAFVSRNNSAMDYCVAASPLAAAWVMKAAGVESRSSWKRFSTATVLSLAMSAGVTEVFKHTVNERRPDGRNNRSFSSGHSALAFAGATILDREYRHISPWISVGGYAAAIATQSMRVNHNAHWGHDIACGAAVGIVSTNLAYLITDCIMGQKEINTVGWERYQERLREAERHQSGVTLYSGSEMGGVWVDSHHAISHTPVTDYRIRTYSSLSAGLDYSHFVTSRWAVEGMLRLNDSRISLRGLGSGRQLQDAHMYQYHADVALKYSMPLRIPFLRFLPPMRIAARAFTGAVHRPQATVRIHDGVSYVPFASVPRSTDWEIGAGCDLLMVSGPRYSGGFLFDYFRTFADILPNRYSFGTTWKVAL